MENKKRGRAVGAKANVDVTLDQLMSIFQDPNVRIPVKRIWFEQFGIDNKTKEGEPENSEQLPLLTEEMVIDPPPIPTGLTITNLNKKD